MATPKVHILDSDPDILSLFQHMLKDESYGSIYHKSINELKDQLHSNDRLIILSRYIQSEDSFEYIKELRANPSFKNIPIILMTTSLKDKQIAELSDLKINFFLSKPINKESVLIAIQSLLEQNIKHAIHSEQKSFLKSIPPLTTLYTANYKTHNEGYAILEFLKILLNDDDNITFALKELIDNSIEHGLYKIGLEKKKKLLDQEKWGEEISKKESLLKNDPLFVNIRFKRFNDKLEVIIIDPGKGFDWKEFNKIDTSRSSWPNGRGIAKALSIEDGKVEYNDQGNQVKVTKFLK